MDNKLRIAIVISHPIQHFCPQYVNFAKNEDFEFKVFFGSALGYKNYTDVNFKKEISWNNLNLHKFDHHFLNGDAIIQPDKNLDASSLEQELDNYNPDLIFCYGYFQKLQRKTYRWAIKNKIPIAYISDSELRHKRNRLKEFFKSMYLKWYFSKISYFLTMGNANESYYLSNGVPSSKLIRMHYPIDIADYSIQYEEKGALRDSIRSEYNLSNDEIVLVVVGKLVPWKNQNHIIEAMKLLEAEGIKLSLFMLGSGEMKEEWEKQAKDLQISKVFFTGFVDINRLPAFYAAADIYVHPASLEPHSVAISEAILMGCPIILSDRCGSYGETDDVQEARNGFVYEFGNIRELADKIKTLSLDKEKRASFAVYSHQLGSKFQQNSHFDFLTDLKDRFNLDFVKKR